MKNLCKMRDTSYRLNELASRAEHSRLVKFFHEEEERTNRNNLLHGLAHLRRGI